MATNKELKAIAWSRIAEGRWGRKLFAATIVLAITTFIINSWFITLLQWVGGLDAFNNIALLMHDKSRACSFQSFLDLLTYSFVVSFIAQFLFGFILAGIMSYGYAAVSLKCARNDYHKWFGSIFGGFKYPLDLAGMALRMWFIFLLWGSLGIVLASVFVAPAIWLMTICSSVVLQVIILVIGFMLGFSVVLIAYAYPYYRYNFLYLMKVDDSKLSIGAAFRKCRAMMKGNVRRIFYLDCCYWKAFLWILVPLAVLVILLMLIRLNFGDGSLIMGVIAVIATLVYLYEFPACIIFGIYLSIGHTLLYEELKREQAIDGGAEAIIAGGQHD